MKQTILKVEGVSKSFGGVIAAHNISFELKMGQIMGLIGPNGAGKTTLLNLISGINELDQGQIYIDGVNVTKKPAYRRARMGLARTFQTPQFLDRSTIRDNLLLGADLKEQIGYIKSYFGRQKFKFEDELEQLMDLAGFRFNWDDDIASMPFGQRKLLEIVRALLEHPKILLVDEPAAGLNPVELERSMRLMKFAVDKGAGIILIEHRMDMVMSFCQDIIVLNFGEMIAHGTPEEISTDEAVIEAYLGRN